ncbi:sigma-70 family RNA polymerase sigma factor [candidate division KSB1 bacterium]|nr:sigma-70 family RNA polymerase sigma factor [candidate division KSB1 bacterium]
MKLEPDEHLIHKYQQLGDIAALESLVDRYLKKTYHFFLSQIKNRTDIDDLVQNVFLKIIRRINSREPIKKFQDYLFICCRNTLRDYFRQKKSALQIEPLLVTSDPETIFPLAGTHDEPEELPVPIAEIEHALEDCINIFPAGKVRNIVWDHVQGYSQQEIAARNHCPLSTAGSIWHRRKGKLLQCVLKKIGKL